jgi:FlaA1/EpsC-like NDP-sugar epimerase
MLLHHHPSSGTQRTPQLWLVAIEAVLIALAGFGAFLLRFEFEIPALYVPHLKVALAIWILVKLTAFQWHQLDRRSWRFFSIDDMLQVCKANLIGSLLSLPLVLWLAPSGFPRSIPIVDLMLCSLFIGTRYLIARLVLEACQPKVTSPGANVLIYGAGRAGVALLVETRANSSLGYNVFGFIDDDPKLTDFMVYGTSVLGRGAELQSIASRTGVREVLIALPSATAEEMVAILQYCQQARVRFRTVAALGEMMESKAIATQIRDVDVQDLLSRDPVELDRELLRQRIEGKVVMVTGAAGSIGSELCRQIARFRPSRLVAFEVAETPLFHLERELRAAFPELNLVLEIGNIRDAQRVSSVMKGHRPAMVYHAAAYKHVPIMESSVIEAITNNVFGTWNVAQAAAEYGAQEFVLISSDKAVHPTSVMGATKRLCELLVRSLPAGPTRFVAVRFGNVLGSNGSVIPLFKQQIAKGGPVTVTHPDMRRYFMTIPEASQLVLQASVMGQGGEIFVLEMGGQVKIVDIARKLILLSGLVPDTDIKIEFSGIRPGEKLYEELNLNDEETIATSHRKIKMFTGGGASTSQVLSQLNHMRHLCDNRRLGEIVPLIQELVPEYVASEHVLRLAAAEPPRKRAQVVTMPPAARATAAGNVG